jgi:hypothetical protein
MYEKLTEMQKQSLLAEMPEIERRYLAGEECKPIGESYGVSPVVVYQYLKQRGVPLRPPKHPRKKKVRMPDAPMNGQQPLPQSVQPVAGSYEPQPFARMPQGVRAECSLFPQRSPGEVYRIAIHRIIAKPLAAGAGFMGDVDTSFTEADIFEEWGGGRYEAHAFNAAGHLIGKNTLKIAGASRPKMDEEVMPHSGFEPFPHGYPAMQSQPQGPQVMPIYPPAAPASPDLSLVMQTIQTQNVQAMEAQKQQLALMQQQMAQQVEWFRQAASARASEQQQFFTATIDMIMKGQANAPKPASLTEELQKLQLIKSFITDQGVAENEDGFAAAVRAIPGTIATIAQLKQQEMAQQAGHPMPQPMPAPRTAAPQMAVPQGDYEGDDGPETLEELMPDVIEALVREKGCTPQEAGQMLKMGLDMIDIQNTQAGRVPPTPAPRPNGGMKPPPVSMPPGTVLS